jgi:hypothetical protein
MGKSCGMSMNKVSRHRVLLTQHASVRLAFEAVNRAGAKACEPRSFGYTDTLGQLVTLVK